MNFAVQSTISLFPWNEKLLVVTCVKTFFYLYPWEPCSSLRPHRMLSTQHFDSPRTLPGAYWDSVRHRKVSQNITGGSKPRGSTYRPPFESLKQTFVQAINPSIAYLLHIWQKKPDVFSTRREDSRPRESGVLWKIEVEVSQCLEHAVHTFRQGGRTHRCRLTLGSIC